LLCLFIFSPSYAALVSDEGALEACSRRCTIQIDDLDLFTLYAVCHLWVDKLLLEKIIHV